MGYRDRWYERVSKYEAERRFEDWKDSNMSTEEISKDYYWKDSKEYAGEIVKNEIIKPAFKELRQKDYICRMNFLCCGGCATSELSVMAKEREKLGGIYWHNQEEERRIQNRSLMFGFLSLEDNTSTTDVGNHLTETLQRHINSSQLPVKIEWDGSPAKKIELSWKNDYTKV